LVRKRGVTVPERALLGDKGVRKEARVAEREDDKLCHWVQQHDGKFKRGGRSSCLGQVWDRTV